jgi:hypothetical protein
VLTSELKFAEDIQLLSLSQNPSKPFSTVFARAVLPEVFLCHGSPRAADFLAA